MQICITVKIIAVLEFAERQYSKRHYIKCRGVIFVGRQDPEPDLIMFLIENVSYNY